jgi:hypothetical protein
MSVVVVFAASECVDARTEDARTEDARTEDGRRTVHSHKEIKNLLIIKEKCIKIFFRRVTG